MKELIEQINPIFDHRNRLGIMSVLVVNDWVDYNTLKKLLDLSDGNLASHIKALESAEYVAFRKDFVGRKPRTAYQATDKGKAAFKQHLDALESLLKYTMIGEDLADEQD